METKSTKRKSSSEAPIFAYFRRSTKKLEQALSLENQADDIDLIIKKHLFDKEKVRFFSESRSAYDGIRMKKGEVVRKRTEFTRMLYEIDQSSEPCIILVKDSSRLSRNKKDNDEITSRLFGEYGARITIRKIIFANGTSWDIHSDSKSVDTELLRNYHASVDTAEKNITTKKGQLTRGIYSMKLPLGLSYWKENDFIVGLRQNEHMPFVRKAFEMKMTGASHKRIKEYLAKNGIKKGERDLNDRFFSNLIFIGEYIFKDKRTGEETHYKEMKFYEGQPPISRKLWEGVQRNVGRKRGVYGYKQILFPLGEVLRTEKGLRLSGYSQKGTSQYKNNMEAINISEKWVISEYLSFLKKCIIYTTLDGYLHGAVKAGTIAKEDFDFWADIGKKFFADQENNPESWYAQIRDSILGAEQPDLTQEEQETVIDDISKVGAELGADSEESSQTVHKLFEVLFGFGGTTQFTFSSYIGAINELFDKSNKEVRDVRNQAILDLENEKKKIETKNQNAMTDYFKVSHIAGMETALNALLEEGNTRLSVINEQISELGKDDDIETFQDRLPDLLRKTFELSSKVLTNKQNEHLKEDILDLIKLTTFELVVDKKKALRVGLYGPVRQVLFGKNVGMEAPPGVEPGYGALQAPA